MIGVHLAPARRVHTGDVKVGNVGSSLRKVYAVPFLKLLRSDGGQLGLKAGSNSLRLTEATSMLEDDLPPALINQNHHRSLA